MHAVATFQEAEGAHLLRSFLEANGISAHLFDEHLVQTVWHYSNAVGGVRVMVSSQDEELAREITQSYFADLNSGPQEVSVPRAWPLVLFLSSIFGAPFLVFGRKKGVSFQPKKKHLTASY
ncbi:MAG: putative signal transducing protein [Roseibacillus sp.]